MANVYLIIGEDEYLVSESAGKIVGSGVGLEVYDSVNATNAENQLKDLAKVRESFLTPPFFDPEKITWWKNVNFLPHQGKGAPGEEVRNALEKFAALVASTVMPENQKFLITGSKLKMDSVFAKTMKGVAEVQEYKTGKSWERRKSAIALVTSVASGRDLVFAPGAAEKFVSVVGCDSRSLMSELEKMSVYLGAGTNVIDGAAVEAIASPGVLAEPEVWSVTDAVGARDAAGAIRALNDFERDGGFVIRTLNALERLFRDLSVMKDASARGTLEQATEGMPPFSVRKLTGVLGRWTLRELRLARKRFFELRIKAVTSGDSVKTLIFTEVVRTCGLRLTASR